MVRSGLSVSAEAPGSHALTDLLTQAVGLSRRMLAAARGGDWDGLAALEAERGRVLERVAGFDARRLPQPLRRQVAASIADILRCNEDTIALTRDWMATLRRVIDDDALRAAVGRLPGVPGDRA